MNLFVLAGFIDPTKRYAKITRASNRLMQTSMHIETPDLGGLYNYITGIAAGNYSNAV